MEESPAQMTSRQKPVSLLAAVGAVLLAILLYDAMGAIVKHLRPSYPAEQLALLRNLFGLLPSLAILAGSRRWIEAGRPLLIRQWRLALLRGVIAVAAQMGFYVAVLHMAFATAAVILYAGPLFVTALSVPLLGHRVGPARWAAVSIGFAGVLMVIRPTADSFSWYAVLPLAAALGYAGISVTAQRFDRRVPTALINLYHSLASSLAAALLVAVTGGFLPIVGLTDWLWIAAMGAAGSTAAYCLIAAYRLADPSSLSPFEYFGIPFSYVIGWLFFAETPYERLMPGVFLIAGGGLFILWRERRLGRRG